MALFGGKKKNDESMALEAKGAHTPTSFMHADVILKPRITEKSHGMSENNNVFIFDVAMGATKGKVMSAIKELYKVIPVKVSVVPVPRKRRVSRGKVGYTGGGRKAYVYLKKGEKIEVA